MPGRASPFRTASWTSIGHDSYLPRFPSMREMGDDAQPPNNSKARMKPTFEKRETFIMKLRAVRRTAATNVAQISVETLGRDMAAGANHTSRIHDERFFSG